MAEIAAMWKIRRLNARVKRAAERHREDPVFAEFAASTLSAFEVFCATYDDVRRGEIPWLQAGQSGRVAVYELLLSARMWMPLAVRDLPSMERSNYFDSRISDDVLDDTERLIAVLRDGRLADGQSLTYRDNAVDSLDVALRAAQLKWEQAEAMYPEYGTKMATLRLVATEARVRLHRFLQAAASILTYLNPEYLELLPSRAGQILDDDDRTAPWPEQVEPATLVTGVPQSLEMPG